MTEPAVVVVLSTIVEAEVDVTHVLVVGSAQQYLTSQVQNGNTNASQVRQVRNVTWTLCVRVCVCVCARVCVES